jgi:hypothetical protein
MLTTILGPIRAMDRHLRLPGRARAEHWKDQVGLPVRDPGREPVIREGIAWLGRAQDNSASADGGVARHFSLRSGWSTSYPETTGYIVPTLLDYAKGWSCEEARQRAKRMLDWLVSIQFPEGAFQGGPIDAVPRVPVTFNTGQILLGLVSGVREFGDEYWEPMVAAADWLVQTQDSDGCWRRYPTPFAAPGVKVYETHVAWALFEAARLAPGKPYAEAARANIVWALSHQEENGWFRECSFENASQPVTHALGYALRGLIEAYRFTEDPFLLSACRRTSDGLLTALREDGFLPGRLDRCWRGPQRWACLTGSVQLSLCWFLLYQITQDRRYGDAAQAVNRYVRRTVDLNGRPEIRGAVKGSFPVSGIYCPYEYPNWATKFFVDANMLEGTVDDATDEY